MKILEKNMRIDHVLEKGSGRFNEDCLIMENNLFGVFDGASSIENRLFEDGKTGGMIASATAGRIFAKNHYPLLQLGVKANQAISTKMKVQNVNLVKRQNLWCTSAAVIRLKNKEIEWLQAGDAHILLLYKDGSYKVLVNREDHDYETLSLLRQNSFQKDDTFMQQVIRTRKKMNRSYGVFNGEPEALDFLNTGHEPLENVETILMFTDGLQLPGKIPQKTPSFDKLVRLYRKIGLTGLKNHIRKIEAKDTAVKRYPRFKCHDDIAAIAVRL